MRPSCYDCALKHVAQAEILMLEAEMGYPEHRYLAIGHLAEAEHEMFKFDSEIARLIRSSRKRYEEQNEEVNTLMLLQVLVEAKNGSE